MRHLDGLASCRPQSSSRRLLDKTTWNPSMTALPYPARLCDVVRGAASGATNIKISPARLGIMDQKMRTTAMSSGVGAILPRVTQARSLDT
jgi:hypothetical protein